MIDLSRFNLIPLDSVSREQWTADRALGIGGSDVGAILGLNEYFSAMELFHLKCGIIQPKKKDNPAMFYGRLFEDNVAQLWEYWDGSQESMMERFTAGEKYRQAVNVKAVIVNPEMPIFRVNVDRLFDQKHDTDTGEVLPSGVLEIKTIAAVAASKYQGEIPPSYYAQIQTYMGVLGFDYGEFAILKDGRELSVVAIAFNPSFFESIQARSEAFFQNVQTAMERLGDAKPKSFNEATQIVADLEPDVQESTAYLDYLKDKFREPTVDKIVLGDENMFASVVRYNQIKERLKQAETEKKAIETLIKDKMRDAEIMDFGLKGQVHYKKEGERRVLRIKISQNSLLFG